MKTQLARTSGIHLRQFREDSLELTVLTLRKSERSQENNLMMHLEILEKQSQAKPQSSRQQEIMTIKTKINKIETKITINSCF